MVKHFVKLLYRKCIDFTGRMEILLKYRLRLPNKLRQSGNKAITIRRSRIMFRVRQGAPCSMRYDDFSVHLWILALTNDQVEQ